MMRTFYSVLFIAVLILPLPVYATLQGGASLSVVVTPRMSRTISLRTEKLRRQSWRPSWTAYGRVISGASLIATARTVIDARQTLVAMRVTTAAADAEYRRLRGLYALHANVAYHQVQSAEARWQADHAALQKAKMGLMVVRASASAEWGSVISNWLTPGSRHLRQLAAGEARLIRLTLPGRTRITSPKNSITLVTIDGARIPATWISVAPTLGQGLQGIAFYAWTIQVKDRLAYGTGVVGLIPHGPKMDGVIVPRTAVIWSGSSAWIFMRSDTNTYRREPISTRYPTRDGWFEPNTPGPGDVIVTKGAQTLFSIQQQQGESSSPPGDDD
ncbi:hypothetical protein BI364_13540 [Acidihalobacter yilgarnensis]|uniref:RND efflux pump membrane fusion protein barrel-sandwich domain-containing protein n=1 Tax=Acidihalobacter yilgarnensis TaxID=2819280 RepID=A0A1D8IQV5_9GAMM|nr:hypothetical protein [Acidihalobacter yilgarnensis]AOU98846.1 hypothetical protein BI364_13540 [Acidihalobacter yilgarnensis]